MSAQEYIFSDLIRGRVIRTRPQDCSNYGTNQIPNAIRNLRRKYGADSIKTTLKRIHKDGGITTQVAEYRMPKDIRQNLRIKK